MHVVHKCMMREEAPLSCNSLLPSEGEGYREEYNYNVIMIIIMAYHLFWLKRKPNSLLYNSTVSCMSPYIHVEQNEQILSAINVRVSHYNADWFTIRVNSKLNPPCMRYIQSFQFYPTYCYMYYYMYIYDNFMWYYDFITDTSHSETTCC